MGHVESPSLISLGLTADISQEGSSFRWGLATSCFLHALVITLAIFLRFQPTIEEPFRAIDVTLISLPETQAPAPTQEKSSPPPSPPKAQATRAQPKEDPLPPLPTQTAPERLSEFLGGAIGSIMVPEKQEMANPTPPTEMTEVNSPKEQPPLIENLQLPPTAPKLSRPERLLSTGQITLPKAEPTIPRQTTQSPVAPPEPQESITPPQPATREIAVKPLPAPPELSPVTPFKKTERESEPESFSTSKNVEESLKRTIPTIPTPAPPPKLQRRPKPSMAQSEKSSIPEVSAPQLAPIHSSQPREKAPQREKLSKMMEQLLGEVKVPNLKPSPATPFSQEPSLSSPSTRPVQSEIDRQIANLSIPSVTPVESIKKRLQLLEVQSTSTPGDSSSQPSPGKNHYLAMVEDKIDHQWVAPPLLASTPVVVLKFRISRSGEISNIHIDESSGNSHYDSAAQRAVHAVNPLPPFPPDISESSFEVRFRFIKKD